MNHKLVTVCKSLFTGYMFVKLAPDQRWAPINSTTGVVKLLTRKSDKSEYLEPCTVPDDFIAGLQQCSNHADPARHNGHNGSGCCHLAPR